MDAVLRVMRDSGPCILQRSACRAHQAWEIRLLDWCDAEETRLLALVVEARAHWPEAAAQLTVQQLAAWVARRDAVRVAAAAEASAAAAQAAAEARAMQLATSSAGRTAGSGSYGAMMPASSATPPHSHLGAEPPSRGRTPPAGMGHLPHYHHHPAGSAPEHKYSPYPHGSGGHSAGPPRADSGSRQYGARIPGAFSPPDGKALAEPHAHSHAPSPPPAVAFTGPVAAALQQAMAMAAGGGDRGASGDEASSTGSAAMQAMAPQQHGLRMATGEQQPPLSSAQARADFQALPGMPQLPAGVASQEGAGVADHQG
jgi:hypothetical protein